MKNLNIEESKAFIRGLNGTLIKQKTRDFFCRTASTIQLLQRIDIYKLTDAQKEEITKISDGTKQREYILQNGKLFKTTKEIKSHSFVIGFLQTLEAAMAHPYGSAPDNVIIYNTSGNIDTYPASGGNSTTLMALESPAGTSNDQEITYGILAGTGTVVPYTMGSRLQNKLNHGTNANNLQYGPTTVGAAGVVGANVDLIIARVFVNASGGALTVTEIGLVMTTLNISNIPQYLLIAWDAVNQSIANGEVAIVTYDIRTTI